MKHKDFRLGIRIIGFILLVIYLMVLGYLVFFSKEFGRNGNTNMHYNLIPLKTITNYFKYREVITFKTFAINIAGNILAFVPFGLILPLVFKKKSTRYYGHITLLWSFLLSLFIEIIQILSAVGTFDVDDLLLNTLGGFVGYIVYLIIRTAYRNAIKRSKKGRKS